MGENGKISFRMIASVWWLIMWRYMVGALVLSFVVGVIGGVVAAYLGLNPHNPHDQIRVIRFGMLIGVPVTAAYGLFVVKMALMKRDSDFQIQIVRRDRSQRREPIVS